ncbi:hypothetical protein VCRLGP8_530504 [Vibrio crassostreae]|nr:hypothetical protein VCR20J5_1030018 [Vibrio crassostreae]CDT04618.1 hypothetical protein VCR15J5_30017 [Vibrio crassostreae]CDT22864.1 hypothetical protein VCRLGP107_320235 [Vibrio crassostreae]CDT56736.1 hypothetical protein VCRLGP7_740615 [Vibrio crassostreae]CDT62887.1 hypothetical protein VCRLGP8_530504 [Vibrio crassostreae]
MFLVHRIFDKLEQFQVQFQVQFQARFHSQTSSSAKKYWHCIFIQVSYESLYFPT